MSNNTRVTRGSPDDPAFQWAKLNPEHMAHVERVVADLRAALGGTGINAQFVATVGLIDDSGRLRCRGTAHGDPWAMLDLVVRTAIEVLATIAVAAGASIADENAQQLTEAITHAWGTRRPGRQS